MKKNTTIIECPECGAAPGAKHCHSCISGNFSDPLTSAIERMQQVPITEIQRVYQDAPTIRAGYEAIRARLIEAAKGGEG